MIVWNQLRGETLRLKEGRLPHLKIREWEFKAIEKGKAILLAHRGKGYSLEVKPEGIDWESYRKTTKISYSSPFSAYLSHQSQGHFSRGLTEMLSSNFLIKEEDNPWNLVLIGKG